MADPAGSVADGQQPTDELSINLADNADLNVEALVRLVSERLGMRIIYEEGVLKQAPGRVVVRGSASISADNLLQLLQATLRVRGLALVQSDVGDFRRIVPLDTARPFVPQGTSTDVPQAEYVTEIFQPKHIPVQIAETYIRTFSSQSGGTGTPATPTPAYITTIPEANLLIVTDLASSMARIETLVMRIDVPASNTVYRFRVVENLEALELKSRLDEILQSGSLFGTAPTSASGNPSSTPPRAAASVQVLADERTNRLLLIGTQWQIEELEKLISELDVTLNMTMKVYRFSHVSPSRVDTLMRQSLGEENLKRVYQAVVDEQANQLIVTSRPDIHEKLERIRLELDVEPKASDANRTVRFYRLKNIKVRDILDSLRAIERSTAAADASSSETLGRLNYRAGFAPAGPNRFDPSQLEGAVPVPPVMQEQTREDPDASASGEQDASSPPPASNILPGRARLTVEENTNTLIVVAEPAVQALYAEMITKLDRLVPQVLIEAKVVTIAGDRSLDLGVELGGGDRSGLKKLFAFTSFGLSKVDPVTGTLSLIPGVGFNGTLVDPSTADAIVRALMTQRQARISSSPRVLVNDNATGTLASVSEVPFLSVNASQTVATTSFAGFAEAGTTIRVTPHISEGDHLRLEFDIVVNDFTGTPTETAPPPRQTDQVTSEVTIPDGHTVIVGGLKRHRANSEMEGIPFVSRIPVVKYLFSAETKRWESESLFVFLRPVILRDDKFRDLRFVSECPRQAAGLCSDYPSSEPVLVR